MKTKCNCNNIKLFFRTPNRVMQNGGSHKFGVCQRKVRKGGRRKSKIKVKEKEYCSRDGRIIVVSPGEGNTQNGKHVVRFSSLFAVSLFAKLSAIVCACMGVSVCESEAQTISFIMLCCRASLKWHDIKNSKKKKHTLTHKQIKIKEKHAI